MLAADGGPFVSISNAGGGKIEDTRRREIAQGDVLRAMLCLSQLYAPRAFTFLRDQKYTDPF
jgi:hypothetical protein